MDKIANQPVLKKSLGERILPPRKASIETEDERVEYVRNHISTQYHLIGKSFHVAAGIQVLTDSL